MELLLLEQACFSGRAAPAAPAGCRGGGLRRRKLPGRPRRPSLRCFSGKASGGHSHHAASTTMGSGSGSSSTGAAGVRTGATAAGAAAAATAYDDLRDFKSAGQRLQRLLAGVGDGEDELINGVIMEQTPEQKIALSGLAGSVICGAAVLLCWLCGLDPLGGASLSVHSLQAALLGALASLPLVAIKAYLWSSHGRQQISWVEDWHSQQVECFKPLMHQLNPAQTAAFMATEVVPGVIILLPCAMAGFEKLLRLSCELVGVGDVPAYATAAAALVATSLVAGIAKLAENTMTYEEYDVIKAALENSDRYYRVMAMNRDSTAADANRAAEAFRLVALTWMARSQLVSQLAGILAAVEVAYLGVMWQETGDLAAPIVAALAASAVDFYHIRRSIAPPAAQ